MVDFICVKFLLIIAVFVDRTFSAVDRLGAAIHIYSHNTSCGSRPPSALNISSHYTCRTFNNTNV